MTAKNLLLKLLDYEYLWALPQRINSKSAMIRRQQIESLQEAFGLSKKYVNPLGKLEYRVVDSEEKVDRARYLDSLTAIEYLKRGEFLHERPTEENKDLVGKVKQLAEQLYPHLPNDKIDSPVQVRWIFDDLLRFRKEIYRITYPDNSMLQGASVGILFSEHLQHNLKAVIKNNLEEIDDTLWVILDPERRVVEKQILIEKHRYPDPDLDKIDLEWELQNH